MADIATYRCSNRQCLLTLRMASDFPVWNEARTSIVRYRSETFCTACNKVVEYAGDACVACASGVIAGNVGRACPRCAVGSLSMPHLSAA